ncbi:hypothetical protein TrLO_g12601 [Triparma laevis f. longispina]|uniref:Uncharacterized protein n=1 Tax=Triparma laevis f. longispina TaxID=1714387 RepID=A0A9W6Z679_9STRA|nr:hypothetical protein TrLO_g12601 [Triparma laevis f. longispina]
MGCTGSKPATPPSDKTEEGEDGPPSFGDTSNEKMEPDQTPKAVTPNSESVDNINIEVKVKNMNPTVVNSTAGKVTGIELSDSTQDNLGLLASFSEHRATFETIVSTLDLGPLTSDAKLESFDASDVTNGGGVALVGLAEQTQKHGGGLEAKAAAKQKIRELTSVLNNGWVDGEDNDDDSLALGDNVIFGEPPEQHKIAAKINLPSIPAMVSFLKKVLVGDGKVLGLRNEFVETGHVHIAIDFDGIVCDISLTLDSCKDIVGELHEVLDKMVNGNVASPSTLAKKLLPFLKVINFKELSVFYLVETLNKESDKDMDAIHDIADLFSEPILNDYVLETHSLNTIETIKEKKERRKQKAMEVIQRSLHGVTAKYFIPWKNFYVEEKKKRVVEAKMVAEEAKKPKEPVLDKLWELGKKQLNGNNERDLAMSTFQQAMEGYTILFGPSHPKRVNVLGMISLIHHEGKDYEKAILGYREVLGEQEKWKDDVDVDSCITTHHNLAVCLWSAGELEDALREKEALLEKVEDVYGETHSKTLNILNNLGAIYDEMKDHTRAIEFYSFALEGRLQKTGEEHPKTLGIIMNIGIAYCKSGEFDKGNEHMARALKGYEKRYGKEHRMTSVCAQNYFKCLKDAGEGGGRGGERLKKFYKDYPKFAKGRDRRELLIGVWKSKEGGAGVCCFLKHDLAAVKVEVDTYQCDFCYAKIGAEEDVKECKQCDFALCKGCFERKEEHWSTKVKRRRKTMRDESGEVIQPIKWGHLG